MWRIVPLVFLANLALVKSEFYEGDIAIDVQNELMKGSSVKHAWLTAKDKLWPGGIIFYQIDTASIPDKQVHENISLAIKDITDNSCLKFNQVPASQVATGDFLHFRAHGDATHDGSGCWSYMGKKGGSQVINIPPPHCTSIEVITHEILHATGALHEHNRPDRDSHVKIMYENIQANMQNNFVKHQWEYDNATHGVESLGTGYDLYSILHYPSNAHGINSSVPTIVSLNTNNTGFGSTGMMSITDKIELNLNYDCPIDSHLLVQYLHETVEKNSLNNDVFKQVDSQKDAIVKITEKQEEAGSEMEQLKKQFQQHETLNNFSFESLIRNDQDLKKDLEKCEKKYDEMATTISEMATTISEIAKQIDNKEKDKEVKQLNLAKKDFINGTLTTIQEIEDRSVSVRYEDSGDMKGNWLVIQRRGQYENPEDYFYKTWNEYENGFGSVHKELWIGLKNLYDLTKQGPWQIQIDLTDWDGKAYFALYNSFRVESAPEYRLRVQHFDDAKSTLGDSLVGHDGNAFSTQDKDQDTIPSRNCAQSYKGGWWYYNCHQSNLNGLNYRGERDDSKGMTWYHGKQKQFRYKTWKSSVMKIRRLDI